MKSTIGLAEAKARFSEVVDRVVAGQRIVILRNGEPAVELRPVRSVAPEEVIDRIRMLRARIAERRAAPSPESHSTLRALAHKGHRR